TRARQEGRAFGVVAARFFLGREGFVHVEAADQDHTAAELLQRFRDERKLKSGAFLQRAPIARRSAMWMPDTDKTSHGARSCFCFAQRRLSRQHRLEKRQR